jgi:hypothetical protein
MSAPRITPSHSHSGRLQRSTYQWVILELTGLGYKHKSMSIYSLSDLFLLGMICLSNRIRPYLCMGRLNLFVVVLLR